jgi:RHS repeat-associated protein
LLTAVSQAVSDSMDYLPYGEQIAGGNGTTRKFTGDEHDSESNLEHTWFRQYASVQGRWIAPDPYLGSMDITNPQSLSRYSYAGNNPINLFDPLGLEPCDDICGPGEGDDGGGEGDGGGGGGAAPGNLDTSSIDSCPVGMANCDTQAMVDGVVVDRSVANRLLQARFARYQWVYVNSYEKDSQGGQGYSTDWYGVTASQEWALVYLDPSQSEFLPNGDRRVGIDLWHDSAQCQGCGMLWKQSAKTGNIIAAATAAVIPGVILVGEIGGAAAACDPGVNLNTAGQQWTAYCRAWRAGNLVSIGYDPKHGLHIGLLSNSKGQSWIHIPLWPNP